MLLPGVLYGVYVGGDCADYVDRGCAPVSLAGISHQFEIGGRDGSFRVCFLHFARARFAAIAAESLASLARYRKQCVVGCTLSGTLSVL